MLEKAQLSVFLKDKMMEYSTYVIENRVLPMIEDGLKPVQRRILWAMNTMNAKKLTKCQNIEGAVMKYHAHGGSYGAMVNMITQNYQNIQPIIGKGNFGDSTSRDMQPAAARYTEAKLSQLAIDMLEGIKNQEVEMIPNFDNTTTLPKFIPFRYPNILCNNLKGIGVGLSTNIMSYNMKEVCEATIKYIETGEHTVIAPDFPTGGYIIKNEESFKQICETGKGSISIKSKLEVDEKNRSIIVTEIPYCTTREQIIEKIIDMIKNKQLTEISQIKDLTGKNGLCIKINYKRGIDVESLLNKLYCSTPLVSTNSANMNVLCDGYPKILGTNSIIEEWVKLRRKSVKKGIDYKIYNKQRELVILKGLEKVLLDIDKAIEIIRYSENPEEEISKYFNINKDQSEYVCNMKLKNINKEVILKRIKEIKDLENEIENLTNINNTSGHNKIICEQIKECMKKYGVERKSEIIDYEIRKIAKTVKKVEDNKEYRVILTKENYIKKTSQNGDPKLKDGDKIIQEIIGDANCEVACFLNDTTCRKIRIKDIPESNLNTLGEYLPVTLGLKDEKIMCSLLIKDDIEGHVIAIFKNNKINKIDIKEYFINRRVIEKAYSVNNDGLVYIGYHKDDVSIKIEGNKKAVVVNTKNLRAKGRTATGIQTLPKSDKIRKISFVK